jgi:hypothetical protein
MDNPRGREALNHGSTIRRSALLSTTPADVRQNATAPLWPVGKAVFPEPAKRSGITLTDIPIRSTTWYREKSPTIPIVEPDAIDVETDDHA